MQSQPVSTRSRIGRSAPQLVPDQYDTLATRLPTLVSIVDDDRAVRMSLKSLFRSSPGFRCVGDYSDGQTALRGIPKTASQVTLMDIRMPGMSGIECTSRLMAVCPGLMVVMVTALSDEHAVRDSLEAGAACYLLKPVSKLQLLAAIAFSQKAQRTACSEVDRLAAPLAWCTRRLTGVAHCPQLTKTQGELLRLVAAGLGQKEVADRVSSTREIIYRELQKVYAALGVSNSTAAVARMVACEGCGERIEPPPMTDG